eukprot:COSAG04_NODE_255_length_18797_cov_46.325968_20_plen_195_part_00
MAGAWQLAGRPGWRGGGPHDPMTAPLSSLGGIGWASREADDPEVAALRDALGQRAGLTGIAPIDPAQPDFAQAAAATFKEHGFCVLLDVLDEERLATIRAGCAKVVKAVVATDPDRTGNRGSHRYGFDGAVGHFGALAHWAAIIDPPALNEALTVILGDGYIADSEYFGGGDFTVPGCLNYQELHRVRPLPPAP